LTDFYHVFSIW